MRFEPTIPVFERSKIVHVLDRADGHSVCQEFEIVRLVGKGCLGRSSVGEVQKCIQNFGGNIHV
jgi:hypothetical protein